MFQFQQRPPPPPRRRPANRFVETFYNLYDDPLQWGLVKSSIGFIIGVIVARQVSEELANGGL